MGVNSLPPRRTITKSPCRSYQLFVRSIVISLDAKFANVSTLVTGKSTHMQSQDRHFFLLFHSAYSQCWWQARWSILYLCREEGFFLLPLATLGPHASQDTYYQVAPRTSLPSLCVCVIVAILTEPLQTSRSGADSKYHPHSFACCPICSSEVSSKCNIQLFFLFLLLSLKGLSF